VPDRLRSLMRLLLVWKISNTKQDESRANPPDCIIMLAFGQAWEYRGPSLRVIMPGPANEAIADVMTTPDRGKIPPVIAQWEYAKTHAAKRGELKVVKELGSRGEYRNTREILLEAKDFMERQDWKSAAIVAHPWHLARCIWIAQNLGIQTVHDQLLVQELNDRAKIWNNQVDVPTSQRQTKSFRIWIWYEFRARIDFWHKGWI